MLWTAIYMSGNYEVPWGSSKWWSKTPIFWFLEDMFVGHIRFTYLKFNELKVQALISTCIKTSYWHVRVGHICSFILEKVQVLNLYLCENKLLNLDTSVECWESPHLKINLKVNDSVPSFSLSFYICWFINVFFIIFAVLCLNSRDKDYGFFRKSSVFFTFFNTNLNDIYFAESYGGNNCQVLINW